MIYRELIGYFAVAISAFGQDPALMDFGAKLGQQLSARGVSSVAVVGFSNRQGYDAQLSNFLADRLARGLASQGKSFEVAGRGQVTSHSEALGISPTAEPSAKVLGELAVRLQVGALITGTYRVGETGISIEASILDGRSQNMIGGDIAKLEKAEYAALLGEAVAPVSAPAAPQRDAGWTERKAPVETTVAPPSGALLIPAYTPMRVRLNERVTMSSAGGGTTGILVEPLILEGREIAPKGADVKLRVLSKDDSLIIAVQSFVMGDGKTLAVRSSGHSKRVTVGGASRAKGAAGGAALGALIRAAAGKGKGAAIGGAAGAVLGTAAGGDRKPAEFAAETVLLFRIETAR